MWYTKGAELPLFAKKLFLQSLPVNAWLLWRFVLQSHQFWLGTKKAELFEAIFNQFASLSALLYHAQGKHKTKREDGKLSGKFIYAVQQL